MKKKAFTISLIVCVVLAAVLLMSVIALVSAKSEIAALKEEIQTLQAKLDDPVIKTEIVPANSDEYYCTLVIDTWTAQDGVLTVDTFTQAVLPEHAAGDAHIELWKSNTVLASQPITLGAGEEDGIYESDVSVQFDLPELSADEELQLWLTVKIDESETIFSCGGGWYLEDGVLMLITG